MATTKKRSLFEELKQGIQEAKDHKARKITLRTHKLAKKPRPHVTPALILATREKLHMSRAIFALKLRISSRTLEKWEQGKTVPNDQAAALILMVRKYPDTLERLKTYKKYYYGASLLSLSSLYTIVERGAPIHANRVLSTIKQAFNYGVSRGSLQYNPASNIRARDIGGTEKPRERFLSIDEIKKVWLFLDQESHLTSAL